MDKIKFGDINFEQNLLDALLSNNLVIFCGAGISCQPPSNLPNFEELVEQISANTSLQQEENEPIDRFLGRLKRKGDINIYEKIISLLSNAKPNPLHRNLIRLFTESNIKIVTTNFDTLIEEAAHNLEVELEPYCAPALPLGKSFTGLVHLHGSVEKENSIIATDDDFGRAYLTEGWARRFLVDLYQNYTILFIGYSHNDPIMEYLSRALLLKGSRYAFCKESESKKWQERGVKPIIFKEYDSISDSIGEIADFIELGAIGYLREIKEFAVTIPPNLSDDTERINFIIDKYPHLFDVLIDNIKHEHQIDWLNWLKDNNYLDCLFDIEKQNTSDEIPKRNIDYYRLSSWITKNFIKNHSDEIIKIITERDFKLSGCLYQNILFQLNKIESDEVISDEVLEKWILILLFNGERYAKNQQDDGYFFSVLAEICHKRKRPHEVIRVFLALARAHANRTLAYGSDIYPSQQLNFDYPQFFSAGHQADFCYREIWEKYLYSNIDEVADKITIKLIYLLEEIYGNSPNREATEHYSRQTIASNVPNYRHAAIDTLIDAVRDSMVELSKSNSNLFSVYLNNLLYSNINLLKRLAIHAIAFSQQANYSADNKFKWLLKHIELGDRAFHPEIYSFFKQNYFQASSKIREKAINQICRCYRKDVSDEEYADNKVFNLLKWLSEQNADCNIIQRKLQPLIDKYPDWQLGEHPDLFYYISSGWEADGDSITVDEFLKKSPDQFWKYLLNEEKNNFRNSPADKLSNSFRNACKTNVSWGIEIIQSAIKKNYQEPAFWNYALGGISESPLSKKEAAKIFRAISMDIFTTDDLSHSAVNFLENFIKKNKKEDIYKFIPLAKKIAQNIWDKSTETDPTNIEHWLTNAINSSAGRAVLVWLESLSFIRNYPNSKITKIPDDYCQFFIKVISEDSTKGGWGRAILCSSLTFLFHLDNNWAKQNIIPLLSDSDNNKVKQSWDGFLYGGRLFPALANNLLEAHEFALTNHIFDKQQREQFIERYMSILIVYRKTKYDDPEMQLFISHLSDDDKIIVAEFIHRFLMNNEFKYIELAWNNWLKKYWQNRASSKMINERELKRMLDWLPNLGCFYPEGVEMVIKLIPSEFSDIHLWYSTVSEIEKAGSIFTRAEHIDATAKLLTHVCRHTAYSDHLNKILDFKQKHQKSITPHVLKELTNALAEKGRG